jgi:mono/diheme cytochrome c family protein/YHS domain-containing protein
MLKSTIVKGIGLLIILASSLACEKKNLAPVPEDLQKQIALGESLFYQKDCVKCHGVEGHGVEAQAPDTTAAPRLTSVYLVADTMLIKYQVSHLRGKKMPKFDLTRQEISAVTQYVASLHAKANTPPNQTDFDARCPVCGAALQKAAAAKNSLETSHNGKFFYFECPDCQKFFLNDPDWFSKSGYARAEQM